MSDNHHCPKCCPQRNDNAGSILFTMLMLGAIFVPLCWNRVGPLFWSGAPILGFWDGLCVTALAVLLRGD